MTTITITVNDQEQGDVLVEATATYHDPAIEGTRYEPGQQAYVEFELDKDVELSEDDCRRVENALIRAIEYPYR